MWESKAMKTTQAWGWLTAGVLALGLNGFYQDGGAVWAHRAVDGLVARIADRSATLADMASERVNWVKERANLVAARDQTSSCRVPPPVPRFQTTISRHPTRMV